MKTKKKTYLIALGEARSVVALICGVLVFFCTLTAVFISMDVAQDTDEHPLHHFTQLSNLLSALGAAFMIPFAEEGIRKKRFTLPRWVIRFQYAGATCVAVTMVTSLALIWPTQGSMAVTGTNLWLHVVAPLCTVVLFSCVESGVALTWRDTEVALIPYFAYMIVYFFMVVIIGKENGGWSDFYMTTVLMPVWCSALLMLAMGVGIAVLLRFIHNKRAAGSMRRIERAWSENMEPAELLVEAFGLGRYIGANSADDEVSVPLDIFGQMAERYDVTLEQLTRAYMKGVLDALDEKSQT